MWCTIYTGGDDLKKFKAFFSIMMILVLIFSFSGCSFRFTNFENLIRPPRLFGNYQGLQEAFEATVHQKFSLLTPETGDWQSSFITYDFDSDGFEEAVVFYVLEDNPEIAQISYFEFNEDEWKHVSTKQGLGGSVDKVLITDLNADGFSELLIGWPIYSSSTNKIFSEYSFVDSAFSQKSTFPYTHFEVLDVNGDGFQDILTLTVDASLPDQRTAVARVYSFNRSANTLSLLGETAVDGNISSYGSVLHETVQDVNLIYVEANKGQTESITEVLYWDDETNKLLSPLFDIPSQSTILTWRNMRLTSYDVDGDKYLEIPTSVEMPGSVVTTTDNSNSSSTTTSDNNPISKMYFTKWVKYRNGKLTPVQYSIVNNYLGYMLNIKSTWVGKITVLGNDGQWDYYRWNSAGNKIGDLLFSVYAYNNSDADDKNKYSGYDVLKTTSTKTYVYQITAQGSSFGINKEWLEKNLVLTDFGG